jgi:hypothetical protein
MITADSRFQATVLMRVLSSDGSLAEPERLHLPYPIEAITKVSSLDLFEYTVQAGDTWHNIAARLLRGRSDLWWIIAEFSGIEDPIAELVVGSKLITPSFTAAVFDVLLFDRENSNA